MTATMYSLLALALTGEEGLCDSAESTETFLAALNTAGWSETRVRSHALQRWQNEEAWPHPLPPHSLDQIGAAQWYAHLIEVRQALGLDVVRMPPPPPRELTREEERLADEVPPHHGPIG